MNKIHLELTEDQKLELQAILSEWKYIAEEEGSLTPASRNFVERLENKLAKAKTSN